MKILFLIGYMGCGKTTLGRAVAERASIPFVDLDELIENENGLTITQLFERYGEKGFREIERDTIRRLARATAEDGGAGAMIVACGGGAPCFFDNIEVMNGAGTTVFLEASLQALTRRLKLQRSQRPLIASLSDEEIAEHISGALAKRLPYYSRASARFDSDRLETIEEVNETTELFISKFLS